MGKIVKINMEAQGKSSGVWTSVGQLGVGYWV